MNHEVSVESFPYFSSPIVYVGNCTCGYRTGKNERESDAWNAVNAHQRAKQGRT